MEDNTPVETSLPTDLDRKDTVKILLRYRTVIEKKITEDIEGE